MDRKKSLEIFSSGFDKFIKRNGYTLEQVGDLLGCGRSNVHKIKSGKNFPSMDGVFILAEKGMTLEEIFGDELADKLIKSASKNNVTDNSESPKVNALRDDTSFINSEAFKQGVLKVLSEQQILEFKMNQSLDKLMGEIKK
jgi:transcriptional regulator with XRE-family HTH domain